MTLEEKLRQKLHEKFMQHVEPNHPAVVGSAKLCTVICETVQEVGEAPNGIVFAGLNQAGISFSMYTTFIGWLKKLGYLTESFNVLRFHDVA